MCDGKNGSSTAEYHHPLDPLTKDEIVKAAAAVRAVEEAVQFEMIELHEPPKALVRSYTPNSNDSIDRCARVNTFTKGDIGVSTWIVSLTSSSILSKSVQPHARPMIQLEEFEMIENVVKACPEFIEGCRKRGITNMDSVCVDPWSAGGDFPGSDQEAGKHISHIFCWVKSSMNDNLYAHPIDGLNAVVDIKTLQVLRVDDHGIIPVPQPDVNFDREFLKEEQLRSDLKPINIEQPQGVSFTMQGRTVQWHDWSILIGFNAREAITLHNISYQGRPICYRAAIAEMVVPYGSPRAPHYRKNVFDIGEYGLGKLANSLELGCDCLGVIQYLDCWINNTQGEAYCIKNGICIHEEDSGILWKHWDFRTERTEVRRGRRLVISSVSTVGNYDYGSYYYFYLDGTIEFEMKATGIINTVGCVPGQPEKYGSEVSPGVVGQIHQHVFCARLDMSIDGDKNTVYECDTIAEEMGPENPYGNAFYVQEKKLETEVGRPRNPATERYWKIGNPNKLNHVGRPTAYKLEPVHSIATFNHPKGITSPRMGFIRNHLWVTAYDPNERYPSGEFVNHSDGSEGIDSFVAKGRSIDNEDLVVWHVFGLHHQPRTEDFPVQPVVTTGFKLMPSGFFDRNPNLDLPYKKNASSCHVCQ